MPERKSATQEMKDRIKLLDLEESKLMRERGQHSAQVAHLDDEIVKVGNKRRQYEFALKQLGVEEDATLENKQVVKVETKTAKPVPIPVRHGV